ncbi:MAG: NADH-quinone oxidoreductase subunit N [Dehalococcoidia bacterium]
MDDLASVDRLGPELILLAFAGIIILTDLVVQRRWLVVGSSLLAVAGSLIWAGTLVARDLRGSAFHGLLVVDNFSLFFSFLFAGIAGVVILASIDYSQRFGRYQAEYHALILASAAGMMLLASTVDLIAIFVVLELTSISLYILVAILKDVRSSEAGLKYLLLGALSTAVTLYGMALLFGLSGSTSLADIANVVAAANDDTRAALVMAMVFLAAGLGFKMAAVPFHMWVPDVYEGAPTPVTAYLSVGSKAAGFAVVMRIFFEALGDPSISDDWANLFAAIAAISMSLGNIVALSQTNIKRMLGYSSIAQAGYLLVGLAAISAADGELSLGASGVIFFLATYAFTNLGAFIAIIAISNRIDSDEIDDYAGMMRRAPLLAFGLTLCLVSLTGIPPTAGFVAKVYIFNAAVQSDLVWLVIIGVLNSVVSAYYYLRVVLRMFLEAPPSEERVSAGPSLGLAMALASGGILFIGILPFPLLEVSETAARVLGS